MEHFTLNARDASHLAEEVLYVENSLGVFKARVLKTNMHNNSLIMTKREEYLRRIGEMSEF